MDGSISLKNHSRMDESAGFTVRDVLPVLIHKVALGPDRLYKSAIQPIAYSDKGLLRPDQQFSEENLQVNIWKKLNDIDQKLTFLLERLVLKTRDQNPDVEPSPVWLGENGIRLATGMKLAPDDEVELRLLIPLQPPAWLILYGIVSRVEGAGTRNPEVTILFSGMDDDIRQMIRFYLLNRQREMIRSLKKTGE